MITIVQKFCQNQYIAFIHPKNLEQVLIQNAAEYVRVLLKEQLNGHFYYHNLQHTINTVEAVKEITKGEKVDKINTSLLIIAAWFHDTGYTQSINNHERESCVIASSFLQKKQVDRETIDRICKIIMATRYQKNAHVGTKSEAIIHDADIISIGKPDFFKQGDLLRKEWEALHNKKYSNEEWLLIQINFLTDTKFLTSYCQKKYNPIRLQHLKNLNI